jgi:hypothetical protein
MSSLVNLYDSSSHDQAVFNQAMLNVFPEYFKIEFVQDNKTNVQKISYKAGQTFGRAKNFFTKTETKAATLVAYWAADAFVALVLILTSTNPLALAISISLLVLHTYATFSIINQIL